MLRRVHWSFWFLICVVMLISACDQIPSPSVAPTASQEAVVLGLPTRTLSPIVSFTPRFTATPIPSITPTPSDTPQPTDTSIPATQTPTTTPTLTPTLSGTIRSTDNVNLREGPGTNYNIVRSIAPGTELGVIGLQTDQSGREWYKVAYADEDGEVEYLWVFATLVTTDFKAAVGSAAATPELIATPSTNPTAEPNRVNILAYCRQKGVRPPTPKTSDNVFVEWSWYVSRSEYMAEHLDNAAYDVRLDGKRLDRWSTYATDMKLEDGVWIVYWYYPVGQLSAGEHKVTFQLSWNSAITDGYQQFGPGTANETDTGDCTFTVVQP